MEKNKENVHLKPIKHISKIPVPVEPLPLLPKHLLMNTDTRERVPLKTIDSSNVNTAPSRFQVKKSQEATETQKEVNFKTCVKQVATSVTVKKDWAQNVFNDNETISTTSASDSVKSIHKNTKVDIMVSDKESVDTETKKVMFACGQINSADESGINYDLAILISDTNETVSYAEDKEMSTLQVSKSDNMVVTPPALIEHRGIKNVKKSLKRPHSRELQGLEVDDKAAEEKVKRRLMFDRLGNKMLASYDWSESHTTCLSSYTSDIFDHLRNVENKPRGVPRVSSITRACIINWLIRINGPGGNPAVIQSACWYLDSYLSVKMVPLLKLQVVAAACYWIAQKLYGPWFPANKMALLASNAFTVEYLRVTEKKVLRELRFPRQPVVPQEFITYLCWWCDDRHSEDIENAATFICLAGLMVDKSLCEEFPSVIAAAAVKKAVLLLERKDLMDRLIMCPVYQKNLLKLPLQRLSTVFCRAVCTISNPLYEYNILLQHHGHPPKCIALKIAEAAKRHGHEPQDKSKGCVN